MPDYGIAMFETLAVASGLGLLLGFRYKVPAVLAISATLLVAGSVAGVLMGWSFWIALTTMFGTTVALQCGYLVGILLREASRR